MTEENLQTQHIPVMMSEVLSLLQPQPNKSYIDCTLGGGGHSAAILEKNGPNGKLFGIDRDLYAVGRAKERLSNFGSRVEFLHGNLSQVDYLIDDKIWPTIDGALIDCGVSSFQLDAEDRGFSFRFDAPLDMRMNNKEGMTAKDFLHESREEEIANTIYQLGDERNSRKIAKNIVAARSQYKLNTTFDLVAAVMKSFPPRHYYKTNPATKTFQAIRMRINAELEELEVGLDALLNKLSPGAKIVVITFHSLEDRLVKFKFRKAHAEKKAQLIVRKALKATREESRKNLRSRSAKVRGIEILPA